MTKYSLYEMINLLRTGLWYGGEVDKLGYIGRAERVSTSVSGCGLSGIYISHDTTLESCEVSAQGGGCELLISQYQPYMGTNVIYLLESANPDRVLFCAQVADIVSGYREPYMWSHNLYKRNSFGIERRYGTGHNSMWGGKIAGPRQSRFFGR